MQASNMFILITLSLLISIKLRSKNTMMAETHCYYLKILYNYSSTHNATIV